MPSVYGLNVGDAYIFQEYMDCFVLLWVDCSLKKWEENVLQHLGIVWY